jgi:hypothetical protein
MRNALLVLAPVVGALSLGIGSVVTAMPSPPDNAYRLEEVQWVWLKSDLDADGRLTRDEVREEDVALVARFDQADLDGNGTLDAGEFELLLVMS